MGTQNPYLSEMFSVDVDQGRQFEILDEDPIRARCPQCGATSRFKLVTEGANSTGPKMGH